MAAVNTFDSLKNSTHPNLVVLSVPDEEALNDAFNALKEGGTPCCGWIEEDLGNTLTAVATAPLVGKERKPLRKFRLLS